jgi:hypothetical protein
MLCILSVIKCTVRMSIIRKYTIMKYSARRCTVRRCKGRKCMIVGRVVVCRMYHTKTASLSLIITCDALEYNHTQRPQIPFNASRLPVHSTRTHVFRSSYIKRKTSVELKYEMHHYVSISSLYSF